MQTRKSWISCLGAGLVQLGRALMLPIAVLPIAGLLLRLGQPDLLNIAFLAEAGGAVFNHLPIIFAVGVAIGFAKDSHGAAALASFIGYIIMTAALKSLDASIDMGVLGGIIVGTLSGLLYNRFHAIKLPPYLAFFGGKRFVPIITGVACLAVAGLAYFIWPTVGRLIGRFGQWTIESGNVGLFFFGLSNRLLIPFGLHHLLNNLVWFQFGDFATIQNGVETIVHGDLTRFFAKDPQAGAFMAGFFPVMMFGLPAACLAMIHTAHSARKKAIAGLLFSMALTSFLTGITEPVEFAFMFLAFPLYVLHAVLTGLSMVIMNLLHVRLGFTFSAGLFDYLLSSGLGTNALWLFPVGLAYAVVYYAIFRFAILRWDLKTPGREDEPEKTSVSVPTQAPTLDKPLTRAEQYIQALGGRNNIVTCGACATRLRLEVTHPQQVDEQALKQLGARGVIKTAGGQVQVIIGPEVDLLADELKPYLN